MARSQYGTGSMRRKNAKQARIDRDAAKVFICKVDLKVCEYYKDGKCIMHPDVHCRNRSRAENWTGYAVG